jgi:hypothetical protein
MGLLSQNAFGHGQAKGKPVSNQILDDQPVNKRLVIKQHIIEHGGLPPPTSALYRQCPQMGPLGKIPNRSASSLDGPAQTRPVRCVALGCEPRRTATARLPSAHIGSRFEFR